MDGTRPPESRLIARRLAANRRLLCAAPAYLARCGTPKTTEDLARHQCITIRQGDEAERDIEQALRSGRLVQVLPLYATPDADIPAAWPQARQGSRRVRAFVDLLAEAFAQRGRSVRDA